MVADSAYFDVGVEYSNVTENDGFNQRVSFTDYTDEYKIENGKIVVTDKPNLLYNDFKVKTARILYLANPEGQAMEIYDNTLEEPIFIYQLPIYSCGLIVIINVLGITLFNRKELK